ncbi:hypothetical protein DRW41_21920 [Neobacillus piezotolerans]|uniref:Uncharacterized protein n=1 Tax=Neobacillus piezotolerans TaxID=2259171 RepID=A0A3D8GJX2_9BACI|nr:hypothetical protein [Neobacillus piezotolerans]RDU34755.1 hypothetical protein DRW41_21920 [Neobacillus piezotolerans]
MVLSRLFIAICTGIFLSAGFGYVTFYLPFLNNLFGVMVCLAVTYIAAGLLSAWAWESGPYMAATITGAVVCLFNYFFMVLLVAGDMIFTPDIFGLSLLLAIMFSNLGALIFKSRKRKREGASAWH